jgi:L-ascorbate metabolism protein UlaG (beta-lactamase superfamily)
MSTWLTVTRISHARQLIEIGGTRILTDLWFTKTATYYPGESVALGAADLGRIDAVVVNHEHYDHCDLDALAVEGFDMGVPLIGPAPSRPSRGTKGSAMCASSRRGRPPPP